MTRLRLLPLVAAALCLGGPARGQALPKRIAVSPLSLPRELEAPTKELGYVPPDAVKAEFDSLIASILTAAGVSVVPASETRVVWKAVVDSAGGFYDTYTGKRIEAKYQALLGAVRGALRERLNAEAWLLPSVVIKSAKFDGTKVKWDGIEEESGATGGILKFLFGSEGGGQLQVLSLAVDAEDMAGKPLYSGAGGIQLLSKIAYDHVERVGRAGLFVNTERNRRACHLALDPALKGADAH